jgi:hypothetical protein
VRVVVVGDVAHVIIDRPGSIDELVVRDFSEDLMKVAFDVVGWYGVVHSPDNHRYETDFAVTDPARLVFEVALREDSRLAELANVAH